MAIPIIILATLVQAQAAPAESCEPAGELRALRGYLNLFATAQGTPSQKNGAGDVVEIGADLRSRLDIFLDREDLSAAARSEAIGIYRDLARVLASAGRAEPLPYGFSLRELYAEVIRHAELAGADTLPLEIEMISCPAVGLDARESYGVVSRMIPRLRDRAATLPPIDAEALKGVLRRALAEPGWPDLDSGTSLASVVELLLKLGDSDRARDAGIIASKLVEWTGRILKAETSREGELAQETGLIHLYHSLEVAGKDLSSDQRWAALNGLLPLVPPVIADGPPAGEGVLRAVEIGMVRLPAGAGQRLPPLSAQIVPEGPSRYFLVPRKSYKVELIAIPASQQAPRMVFGILARPGLEFRLSLPRCIPAGMAPVTAVETGRITFLADRKPWTIRRFLLAFQRCGDSLAADRNAVARIYRQSALREISLGADAEPTFAALAGLLAAPAMKDRLEGTFWIEAKDEAGRRIAFEVASAILNGNTGLRDTALQLPTTAEANRLLRDGERFDLVEPYYGLFNAIRLVPDQGENQDRTRYAIRTVLRVAAP